jgi:purine-binding chemotaxis protein CheW
MERSLQYFVFGLEDQRYALALAAVLKVIRAVELTYLPDAPDNLVGLLNMGGEILPVLNIRRRFSLAHRDVEIDDRIVICKAGARTVAFITDMVVGVVELTSEEVDEAVRILPEMAPFIEGVGKLDDNTVLIYDLNRLFSIQEIEGLVIQPS